MSQFTVEVVERPADSSVVLAPELTEAARKFAAESRAANTKRAYQSDWRLFKAWCDAQGVAALRAEPSHVAAYLAAMAESSSTSTVLRRAASIASGHRAAGYPSPVSSEVVKAVLRGIRRSKGTAQAGKKPALTADVRAMVKALPDSLIGTRDAALLLTTYGAALRRSEAAALDVADIETQSEGLLLTLRKSKTDQEQAGRLVGLLYGSDPATCPVRTLQRWLEVSGISEGAVFRSVDRHGRLGARLSPQSVRLIVRRRAAAIGRNADDYGAHSLRSGHATQASANGASERSIMNVTGHRSLAVVRKYIKRGSAFSDTSGASLGL